MALNLLALLTTTKERIGLLPELGKQLVSTAKSKLQEIELKEKERKLNTSALTKPSISYTPPIKTPEFVSPEFIERMKPEEEKRPPLTFKGLFEPIKKTAEKITEFITPIKEVRENAQIIYNRLSSEGKPEAEIKSEIQKMMNKKYIDWFYTPPMGSKIEFVEGKVEIKQGVTADVLGGVGSLENISKNIIKNIAKSKVPEVIIRGLEKIGIKNYTNDLINKLVKESKQVNVEKLIKDFQPVKKVGGVPIIKPIPKEVEELFHSTDKTISNVVKAGEYSPQNYFGEGIYLGSKEGIYPGRNTYKIAVPEGLKTLDLTKGNSADLFLKKISNKIGISIEKTGMGVYEDLRLMAEKSSDIKVRDAVNELTKGYEAIKSPLEYEGTYELVVRKPQLFTTDFYAHVIKGIKEVKPEVKPPTLRELGIVPKISPFITSRARETTLLKERIREIQKSAKTEMQKKIEITRLRNQFEERLAKTKRVGELKELRTGITQRIKGIEKGIRKGSIAKREDILKAGNELKSALKEAEVSPEDAKWFIDTFKNIKGIEDLANKLPMIIGRADRLANAREIRQLKTSIKEEIKTTKPVIGEKKALESKFGAEAQRHLDFLRGATKESVSLTGRVTKKGNIVAGVNGSRSKALFKIEQNINKYGVSVEGVSQDIPPEIAQQNALLNMVGIQKMSVEELRVVLENIKILKEGGQIRELIKQSNKASELEQIKDWAKTEFRPTKEVPKVLGETERKINPVIRVWHMIDNALLGIRNITEKLTFSKTFKVSNWVGEKIRIARNAHNRLGLEWNNAKVRAFKSVFGEKGLGKINKELNKEQTVFKGKDYLGNNVEMKLTQFEAAYWHALAKDPTNIPLFIKNMNFTPEMFKALDSFVKPEVKEYVAILQDNWLKTIREKVNERYVTKFGMDMPNNPNYMPRLYSDKKVEEEITNLLIGEAFPNHPSTVPSGVKVRIGSKAQFRKISIESVLRRHGEQMNQFVNFDEPISDLRRVFSDPEVKDIIMSQKGGKQLYDTLTKKIDDIARGGMAAQMKLAAIDTFIGNFTKASLMFNWVPFLKQLTSFPAFTLGRSGVTYPQLISGAFSYFRHPIEWTKMLCESDFIWGRLTKGFEREVALVFRQGNKNYTIKEVDMTLEQFLKYAAIIPTRGGDMVPILPGMVAKYKQVIKELQGKGLSAEEIHKRALAEAEVVASRTQQSPYIEDMGRIQTANSLGKGISMYATTPIQYHRETIGMIRMWSRGQGSFWEMIRAIITGWIILPQLFQWISDGGSWNNERQLRALILGPWNYYPAAGNLMGTMYDAFAKGETWKTMAAGISPLFSIPEDVRGSANALGKIMFRDGDIDDWRKFAEKLYTATALTTGKLPSTAPRTIRGVEDLLEGETANIRRLFFSEYTLNGAGKEPAVGGLKFDFGDGQRIQGITPLKFNFTR